MPPIRPTSDLSRIVDQGVTHPSGRRAGAKFMLDRGVPFPVIVRVLDPLAPRRSTPRRAV